MAVGEENKKKKALAKRKRVAYGQKNNKLLLEIKKYIEQKIMYDNAKENAFNRLYQEMNRYKLMDAELDRHIEPLLRNIVSFYDSIMKFRDAERDAGRNDIVEKFDYLIDELLEIMYRVDMTPIEGEATEEHPVRFNAQTQRAIKVDFTDKKEEDYLVEAEKRKGFLWKGKVFRPEEVIIKRYRKAK
ncbi:MAG: Protein GrpE [Firmicutes bacterium]|nr:Protein GrpE [Bacillota bacterium]